MRESIEWRGGLSAMGEFLEQIFGWGIGLFLAAIPILIIGRIIYYFWSTRRRGELLQTTAPSEPLVYVDAKLAVAPTIAGHAVPEGYRLASLFFGAGLIDRTQTLDQGFDYKVLDPIPEPTSEPIKDSPKQIGELLARRAAELRRRSDELRKPVRLFWSGGIDSTAAAAVLLPAFVDAPERLEIVHTVESEREYRLFYRQHIARHPGSRRFKRLRDAMDEHAILCTGEHGDQLFGSMKAMGLRRSDLMAPWERTLPKVLKKHLRTSPRADAVLRYLEPQIAACPIPLPRLFDLLWWLNFSLKWQSVTLRMFANGDPRLWALSDRCEHFFRPEPFQRWALANPDKRIKNDWRSYKWPLKQEILTFTGGKRYFDRKQKIPSLRGRMGARSPAIQGLALGVGVDGAFAYQEFDRSLRGDGGWLSLEISSEGSLWRDLDDGE